jgi:hypothetical protein
MRDEYDFSGAIKNPFKGRFNMDRFFVTVNDTENGTGKKTYVHTWREEIKEVKLINGEYEEVKEVKVVDGKYVDA